MTIIKENGGERREHDFYETPLEVAATAMYHIPCEANFVRTALDPGAGSGIWAKALRLFNPVAHITGVEIQPPHDVITDHTEFQQSYDEWHFADYLEWETENKYDLIMGNPPYKLAHEFIDKSLDLLAPNGQLVFLLRLAMLESMKRYRTLWTQSPIYKVYVSTRRISFTGDRKTDDTAYGIFVWKDGFDGKPQLDWMHWEWEVVPKPVATSAFPYPIGVYPDWHYESIEKEGENEDN